MCYTIIRFKVDGAGFEALGSAWASPSEIWIGNEGKASVSVKDVGIQAQGFSFRTPAGNRAGQAGPTVTIVATHELQPGLVGRANWFEVSRHRNKHFSLPIYRERGAGPRLFPEYAVLASVPAGIRVFKICGINPAKCHLKVTPAYVKCGIRERDVVVLGTRQGQRWDSLQIDLLARDGGCVATARLQVMP